MTVIGPENKLQRNYTQKSVQVISENEPYTDGVKLTWACLLNLNVFCVSMNQMSFQ